MLIFWAIALIATLTILLITGRVSPLVVLVLTPVVFGLCAGFGTALGPMMLKGVAQLSPTAVMLGFAVLYFSLMVDAGLFDPLIHFVVKLVHGDPLRVLVGTAVLGEIVSFDGNGATSYIICTSALLPLYRRMGIDPLMLAGLLVLSIAIGHVTPWGGPTARIASILGVDPADVYVPLIPAMALAAAFVIGLAYMLGRQQRQRLSALPSTSDDLVVQQDLGHASSELLKRPKMFIPNVLLTAALLTGLILNLLPLHVMFMIAAAIALQINYPNIAVQAGRITAHAPNIFKVVSFTFAVGIFLGVLEGTGMTAALGNEVTRLMPAAFGPYLAMISALVSMPFYYFAGNDSYFFGVVPVLMKTAAGYGLTPVEMARASVIAIPLGLLCPLAASTYVLVGLVGIEYSALQRFTVKWAILLSFTLLVGGLLTHVIPWRTLS